MSVKKIVLYSLTLLFLMYTFLIPTTLTHADNITYTGSTAGGVGLVKVTVNSSGGWSLSWNSVTGALSYNVYVNHVLYTNVSATFLKIDDRAGYAPSVSPYPLFSVAPVLMPGVGLASESFGCTPFTFVSVRGSGQNTETTGYGESLGNRGLTVVNNVRELMNASVSFISSTGVSYPATDLKTPLGWWSYKGSVETGVSSLLYTLQAYSVQCPSTKFVLFGYSQGADVVGTAWPSIAPAVKEKIVRAVLFGDPKYNPSDSSASISGIAYAGPLGARPAFNDKRVHSMCMVSDVVCQGSPTNLTDVVGHVHGDTYDTWQVSEAVNIVEDITKLNIPVKKLKTFKN